MRKGLVATGLCLVVGLVAAPVSSATTVAESGDAGNLPGSAQVITDPAVTQITGTIDGADQDMYAISVGTTQSVNLVATTVSSGDPRLYLFNSSGVLIASNDDCTTSTVESCISRTLVPDTYYIAITGASVPVPGSGAVTGWSSQGAELFTYAINLSTTTGAPPVNHRPTAANQSLTTSQDVPVNFTLFGSDPDHDPILFSHTNPAHGTLNCTGSSCRYTPFIGYTGPDSAQYTVTDVPGGLTATATLSFTVGAATPPGRITTTLSASIVHVPLNTKTNLVFSATLTEAGSVPVVGRLVTFRYGTTFLCSARTSSTGVATCSKTRPRNFVASHGYTATFAGDASYFGSTAMGTFN